jgi:hypothetical protein
MIAFRTVQKALFEASGFTHVSSHVRSLFPRRLYVLHQCADLPKIRTRSSGRSTVAFPTSLYLIPYGMSKSRFHQPPGFRTSFLTKSRTLRNSVTSDIFRRTIANGLPSFSGISSFSSHLANYVSIWNSVARPPFPPKLRPDVGATTVTVAKSYSNFFECDSSPSEST